MDKGATEKFRFVNFRNTFAFIEVLALANQQVVLRDWQKQKSSQNFQNRELFSGS